MCPDFDTNRLLKYLMRGLWPFLVSLIVSFPVGILIGVLTVVGVFGGAALASKDPTLFWIVLPIVILVSLVLNVLTQIVLVPLCLRAGLGQDFGSAFSLEFAKDFLTRMWKELLLTWLFFLVTGPFVILAGLLACFVGIYFAQVILVMAKHHFWFQFYDLYLERGGMPIPLQAQPADAEDLPDEN
jgi:hypothetical protein